MHTHPNYSEAVHAKALDFAPLYAERPTGWKRIKEAIARGYYLALAWILRREV